MQIFLKGEEKDLEKSTSRILSSTNNFLFESPDNKRISHSPILSSTVKKLEKPKGIALSMTINKATFLFSLSKYVHSLLGAHYAGIDYQNISTILILAVCCLWRIKLT